MRQVNADGASVPVDLAHRSWQISRNWRTQAGADRLIARYIRSCHCAGGGAYGSSVNSPRNSPTVSLRPNSRSSWGVVGLGRWSVS